MCSRCARNSFMKKNFNCDKKGVLAAEQKKNSAAEIPVAKLRHYNYTTRHELIIELHFSISHLRNFIAVEKHIPTARLILKEFVSGGIYP